VACVTRRITPIVALDVPNSAAALAMVDELGDLCRFYKIGSELFAAEGPAVIRAVQARGADIFLDLKFHDIPNTVKGAVRSAAGLGVRLVTVHGSGGSAMLAAAVAGAHEAAASCEVLAVTILTSLDAAALSESWGHKVADVEAEVLRLAGLATAAGVHGIVCSGKESAAVTAKYPQLATLVPGVRLAGGATQDQARVVTPSEAAKAGARYIVLGRAVSGAASPADAMRKVLADLP
jgi:orotidine-5'-phosphate decarboxylase